MVRLGRGRPVSDETKSVDGGAGSRPVDGTGTEQQAASPPVGKGRPTPTRSQAQAERRRPLVGAGTASKERRREMRRESFARTQDAYRTEDQRYLPERDRGQVRRYVRDVVDGRRNLGQYFLPAALVVLGASLVPVEVTRLVSFIGLYTVLGVVTLDSFLVFRTVRADVRDAFGADTVVRGGHGWYGVTRALQMRRMRRPLPQVKHGEAPRDPRR